MSRRATSSAVVGLLLVIGIVASCGGGAPTNAGKIIFGTAIDVAGQKVTTPVTSAAAGTSVGWIAYLSEAVNTTSMTAVVVSLDQSSAETPVASAPVTVSNPAFNVFTHAPDQTLTNLAPGTYKLRYLRPTDNKVLAEGTIQITP